MKKFIVLCFILLPTVIHGAQIDLERKCKRELSPAERQKLHVELTEALSAGDLQRIIDIVEQGIWDYDHTVSTASWLYTRPEIFNTVVRYIDQVPATIMTHAYVDTTTKAQQLIDRGAEPILAHHSAGNPEVVEFLIMQGADVNSIGRSEGSFRVTPLIGAILDNNVEVARLLLQHHADPLKEKKGVHVSRSQRGVAPKKQDNAYDVAANRGSDEMKKLLRDYALQKGHTKGNPLFK